MKPLNEALKISKKPLPIIGMFGAAPLAYARLEGYNAAIKDLDQFVLDRYALLKILEPNLGRVGAEMAATVVIGYAEKWIIRKDEYVNKKDDA